MFSSLFCFLSFNSHAVLKQSNESCSNAHTKVKKILGSSGDFWNSSIRFDISNNCYIKIATFDDQGFYTLTKEWAKKNPHSTHVQLNNLNNKIVLIPVWFATARTSYVPVLDENMNPLNTSAIEKECEAAAQIVRDLDIGDTTVTVEKFPIENQNEGICFVRVNFKNRKIMNVFLNWKNPHFYAIPHVDQIEFRRDNGVITSVRLQLFVRK